MESSSLLTKHSLNSNKKELIIMRLLMIGFFVFSIALSSFAQQSIEIQCGINIAKFTDPGEHHTNGIWSNGSNNGIVLSASPNFILGRRIVFAPGLRFVQKGGYSKYSWPEIGVESITNTIEYLELPLYIKYEVANSGPKLYVVGGPAISYLLSARSKDIFPPFLINSISNDKNFYRKYDASLDLGLSMQIPINEMIAITGTGLYSFGLIIVRDLDGYVYTRDIKAMIGVSFAFRK
jgi:hypothetical protein